MARATGSSESANVDTQELAKVLIGCQPCLDGGLTVGPIEEARVITKFIAETLLPTRFGNFRVRAYKHSVC